MAAGFLESFHPLKRTRWDHEPAPLEICALRCLAGPEKRR